jgi:hypothetical protein
MKIVFWFFTVIISSISASTINITLNLALRINIWSLTLLILVIIMLVIILPSFPLTSFNSPRQLGALFILLSLTLVVLIRNNVILTLITS